MTESRRSPSRRAVLGAAAALGAATATSAQTQLLPSEKIHLKKKSVLITGTSSGFGRLAALHFARLGATVVASMRNLRGGKRPEAQELLDVAASEKLALSVVEIDVTRDDLVASGVATAQKTAGGALDVLVNNAGVAISGPVEIHDPAQVFKQFDTNLFGAQRMARAVLPAMRARGQGLVIQVTSQLGRVVVPCVGLYSGTKFAAEAMFEAMAYELAPFGVEVTIVEPGGYPTKIWENGARYTEALLDGLDPERKAAYARHVEIARMLFSGGGTTDPMDVPKAMAEIIAMPPGRRPLRRPVHVNTQATTAVNAALAQVEARLLGQGPFKEWHAAVVD